MKTKNLVVFCLLFVCTLVQAQERIDMEFKHGGKFFSLNYPEITGNGKFLIAQLKGGKDSLLVMDIKQKKAVKLPGLYGTVHGYTFLQEQNLLLVNTGDLSASTSSQCFIYDTQNFTLKKIIPIGKAKAGSADASAYFQPQDTGYERLLAVENGALITINFKREILAVNMETGKTDSLAVLKIPESDYFSVYTATYNKGKLSGLVTTENKQIKILWYDVASQAQKLTDVPSDLTFDKFANYGDNLKWYLFKQKTDNTKDNLLMGLDLSDGTVVQSMTLAPNTGNIFVDQETGSIITAMFSEGTLWKKDGSGKYTRSALNYTIGNAGLSFLRGKNAFVSADYSKLWVFDLTANNEAYTLELSLDNKDNDSFAGVLPLNNDQLLYILSNDNGFKFRSQPVKLNKSVPVADEAVKVVVSSPLPVKNEAPHLVIQQGHQAKPNSIVFAKSRGWLISGDESGALVFWDKRSMLQVKKIRLNRDGISGEHNYMHLALHPTKEIIAVSWNYNAVLWLDFNGNEINRLKTDGQSQLVHFSEDGKYFFYAQSNNKLSVLDLEKGNMLSTYSFDTYANVLNYAFNADSRKLALPTASGTVKILNALTGELTDEVKTAHTNKIRLIAFHPKEDVIATLGNPLELCFTNLTTKKTNSVLKGGTPGVGDMIWGFLFKKDGEIVLSGPFGSKNADNSPHNLFTAKYDPATNYTGSFTFYENKKDLTLSLGAVADADEQTIFTLNTNNTIEIWDVAAKAHTRTIRGSSERIEEVLVTPDFKGLLVGTSGYAQYFLRKFDLGSANINSFDGIKYGNQNFHANEDGTYLASFTGKATKIDLRSDAVLGEISNKFLDQCVANTPYGTVFYGASELNIIPKGSTKPKLLYKFNAKEDQPVFWDKIAGINRNYGMDPERKKLYLYDFEKFRSFDLLTGKSATHTSEDPLIKQINAFKITGDRAIVTIKNILYTFEFASGKFTPLTDVLKGNPVFSDWLYHPVMGLSSKGTMAISYAADTLLVNGSSNQKLEIFNPDKANSSIVFPVGSEAVKQLVFSADEQLLYVVYTSEIGIINIAKRELAATIAFVSGGKFIIYTPDNYYFASPKFSEVGFNVNDRIYDITQFDLKFNRPDIILERLGLADKKLIELYRKAYERRLDRLNIKSSQLEVPQDLPEVRLQNKLSLTVSDPVINLELELKKGSNPLNTLFITVNDVPVEGMKGIDLKNQGQLANMKQRIILSSGNNVISIYANDASGAESLKTTISIDYKPAVPVVSRTIFAGVGVSAYRDTTYNLTYADKDIKDLEGIFKGKNAATTVLLNADATKESLVKLKQQLMKTTEDDVVILSLSGHGLVNRNGDFFFAGYETDFKKPETTGVPFATLEWLLDGIPARRKLLMIDACHSGELGKDITTASAGDQPMTTGVKATRRGIEPEASADAVGLQNSFDLMKQLFTDLSKSNGAEVISAAGGLEFAFEDAKYKNGVFTYCLKKALVDKAADADKNGNITIGELKTYMIREVSRLTGGRQKPTIRQEAVDNDWKVW